MLHFRKDFTNVTRDYRAQDEAGLPEVTPTVNVDDAAFFVERTWPTFAVTDTQAAVAAVYSLVGIGGIARPLRILTINPYVPAAQNVYAYLTEVDMRTANQGTQVGGGLERGQTLLATTLTGTTTVAPPAAGSYPAYVTAVTRYIDLTQLQGFLLRPREYLFLEGATVNLALSVAISWQELQYPLQANPTSLI